MQLKNALKFLVHCELHSSFTMLLKVAAFVAFCIYIIKLFVNFKDFYQFDAVTFTNGYLYKRR